MNNEFYVELYKKYDEFIESNKYDMIFFEIYYAFCCANEEFKNFNVDNKKYLIDCAYLAYLKDGRNIDLCLICEVVMDYVDAILSRKLKNIRDILKLVYDRNCS